MSFIAGFSPTSEHSSPSRQSTEESEMSQRFQQPHYSSQDSLPDSPYSSQSLDSQPPSNSGKI